MKNYVPFSDFIKRKLKQERLRDRSEYLQQERFTLLRAGRSEFTSDEGKSRVSKRDILETALLVLVLGATCYLLASVVV